MMQTATLTKDSPFYHADEIKAQPATKKSNIYSYTTRDVQIVRMLEKHKAMTAYVIGNLFWPHGSTAYKDRLKYLTQTGFMTRYELYNQGNIALTVYGVGPTAKKFIPDLEYEEIKDPLQAVRYAAANRFYLMLRQNKTVPEYSVMPGYIAARFNYAFVDVELSFTLCIPRPADNIMTVVQAFRNLPPSDSRVIVLASSREHAVYLASELERAGVVVPVRYTWDRLMAEAKIDELFWAYRDGELKRG
ncbi:MAG: hypothetical protein HPY90_10235 [Syntrophothermus sp.]|uniref:hypothetical protein n=1 Tax=Syntrophothermus sp. TaxID=2736299 RepID=UPI00257B7684|nr:hypothetical protein [Syntrophothermus sp.]NSW83630.1 hypothetical protein [Syntrophothermus sp.]